MAATAPHTQHAVQLVGPSELKLNTAKPVPVPGAHEILAKVEAVGLCFSDLKLLKQFDQHARKTEIVGGIAPAVLGEIQAYQPGTRPTVPGHEVVCRVVAVGEQVKHHRVGQRCLVQADYRQFPTAGGSNAAFGYNFEGGLQEYTVLDERVVVAPDGDRFLIPAGEDKSASAVALVEPWACVEASYATRERQRVKAGGRLLVVVDSGREARGVTDCYTPEGAPAHLQTCAPGQVAELPGEAFDDIIYFGSDKATLDVLNDKLAAGGIMNIVLGGQRIGQRVSVGVGRLHYGMTRWIGTVGEDASESYRHIPATGEIRDHDRILVVGAGGPMGEMHVIRNLCAGCAGLRLIGTDLDDRRLESLRRKADFGWPGEQETFQTANGANGFGLYDMSGNVWQWCTEWYERGYYAYSPAENPPGPAQGSPMPDGKPYRCMRGGSWFNGEFGHGRVSNRDPSYYRGPDPVTGLSDADGPWFHIGFRVVLPVSAESRPAAKLTPVQSVPQIGRAHV